MPYLIDGHNLIGNLSDIHLDDPDDEIRLIQRLVEFFKNARKSGTVYFDQRGYGAQRKYKLGRLQIEFVTPPNTADGAIQNKVRRLKREARNYTVVSSDREVMQAASNAGAQVIDSQTFIRQLEGSRTIGGESEKPESPLTPEDIKFWQQLFENPSENGENL
jgi:predicted RNA-binding protein with PIN domain